MATGGGSQGPEFQVHVLGHPKEGAENAHGQLGACPFSHRVLLLLEEKAVPYTVNFVDVQNKPAWVSEANPQGSLPIIKNLKGGGQFLYDSDAISDFLEDKYGGSADPEADSGKRSLRKLADCPQPGAQLWPAFLSFLGAQPGSSEEEKARGELQAELQAVEQAVPNESPFVGGHDVCAYDCALAPRLYLARQGCKLLKGWDWADEEHDNVKAYLHRMMGRPSWRNTASWDDDCIAADLRRKMPTA